MPVIIFPDVKADPTYRNGKGLKFAIVKVVVPLEPTGDEILK